MTLVEAKLAIGNSVLTLNSVILDITNTLFNVQSEQNNISVEDYQDIETMFSAIRNIHFCTTSINDTYKRLGTQRYVERYFNVKDGELVEVPKENFDGNPDDVA